MEYIDGIYFPLLYFTISALTLLLPFPASFRLQPFRLFILLLIARAGFDGLSV